eukprot:TRINITY_DN17074_c0_g1_i2.p1 TRINITY_DN17074_c0_g1~~TRINITY_DN17074_c0_g1_i2.p1  ORF type:complete len:215 (+),score=52.47 TRINITY_DN17074_c0_g1_i2:204-848(+)
MPVVETKKKTKKIKKKQVEAAVNKTVEAAQKEKAKENENGSKKKGSDINDIFSNLKGKKPAARKSENNSKPAENLKPGAPYVTGPHRGYIAAGGNLLSGKMTIPEAKKKALKNPACMGFTFTGKPGPDGKVMLWLKNKYPPASKGLEETNGTWVTYKIENRERSSDTFMDLRGEGSTAKIKTTRDGLKIYSADELLMDEGGFTKDCPFDCECCY